MSDQNKRELLDAAQHWRNAAFREPAVGPSRFHEFLNTARELEHLAETGEKIELNKRIVTKPR